MPYHFFDTSAISKHYHVEVGTPKVDAFLSATGAVQFISRLSVVEFHSVFAKKVRTGQLGQQDFHNLCRLFIGDIGAKRLQVLRFKAAHFQSAAQLIRRHGLSCNLRTLDALQLAVALSVNEPVRPVQFVCADQALCVIAAIEGLCVVNPEAP